MKNGAVYTKRSERELVVNVNGKLYKLYSFSHDTTLMLCREGLPTPTLYDNLKLNV